MGILAVLALCAWLLVGAAVEDHTRREVLERLGVGILCGAYAACQGWLLVKGRLRWWSAVAYYVLCPALALLAMQALGGYAKGWAPASAEEATAANAQWFVLLAVLVVACAVSFLSPRGDRMNR
jgi:hypothetical protein